jgi:probable F420-dependent oxidoreductase
MRYGLTLVHSGEDASAEGILGATLVAERLGLAGVWVYDHLMKPAVVRSTYPYAPDGVFPETADTPFYDPLALFGVLSSRTSRIRVGAEVFVAPYRHPIVLAKTLATLEQFAPGRLVCGLGAGWMEEEFDAVGVPYGRRGARLAEYVQALRAVWSGAPVAFEGEFYRWAEAGFLPAPTTPIPILLGGHADVAVRRAARIADGFIAIAGPGETGSVDDFRARLQRVRGFLDEAGRDPAAYQIVLSEILLEFEPEPDPERLLVGPADLLKERVAMLAELGVDEIMLLVRGGPGRIEEVAGRFLAEVA